MQKHHLIPLAFAAVCNPLLAQNAAIEEVLVYGEIRETALDELPASVSVIDADRLARRSARHLDDALALSANVNVASGASRSRFFQIRGIGERGQFIEPLNPSVGVLIDGVDLSNSAAAATLFDIEQIEVFRGPQGTRYGANALAGLINVRTNAPSEETEASIAVDAANYDALTLSAAAGGPLGEGLSGRIAFQQHNSDGFIDNTFLGSESTNERDETSVRGKLRWEPTEELTIDAMLGLVDIDNGYDAFSLDNDRFTRSDEPGRDTQESQLGSLSAGWNATQNIIVQASLGLAESESSYGYDEDWTFVGFDPFEYSSTDLYLRDRSTLTAELRVQSGDAADFLGGRGSWAVGAYQLSASEDLDRDYTFAAGRFSSEFDVDRTAVFAQLDFDLSAATRLTAGLRIEEHESDYSDSGGAQFSPQDNMSGWRIGVDHTIGNSLMVYGLLAGGYKAGGFNTDGSLTPDRRTFDPEESTNLEFGIKGDLLDGRLQMRLAMFRMERDDIQIEQSIVVTRSDGSSEFIDFIGNGITGTNSGLEADLLFYPTDDWQIQTTIGLLDTEYDSYVNPAGDDLSGRAQPHAPEYQFAISALRNFGNESFFEIGVEGRDAFFFSSSHSERSRSYTSINAAFGFTISEWSLRLWGRNLTDEDIQTRGFFFGNDPRLIYDARGYTQLAEPRRVGIGFSRDF